MEIEREAQEFWENELSRLCLILMRQTGRKERSGSFFPHQKKAFVRLNQDETRAFRGRHRGF
jgi:hypothetical protein